MGELTRMIQQRLDDAYASLRSAHAAGGTYLADIRQEEDNELRRIAANNDTGGEPPRRDGGRTSVAPGTGTPSSRAPPRPRPRAPRRPRSRPGPRPPRGPRAGRARPRAGPVSL